ncbi:MAG: hypothetical protein ACXIVQ_03570 [Acidimicrobiales bacterium]
MFAVAVNEFGYQLVYLLHIVTVVVAFAAAVVNPRLGGLAKRLPGDAAGALNQTIADASLKIHFPALVLAGLFGTAMIPMSNEIYSFADMWISSAFLVWFAMMAVMFFLLIPAQRALAADPGDVAAGKKFNMFGGIIHLLLLIMLILMVWKPGAGA